MRSSRPPEKAGQSEAAAPEGYEALIAGRGKSLREHRRASHANQINVTERRMRRRAPLQELIIATVLMGNQVRVQRIILSVVKGNAH